jgi:glutaredoxin
MTYKIYSKEGCRYCKLSKEFLDERKIPFEEILLNPSQEDYEKIRDNLIETTGQRTFPWIFQGDSFIGGYFELLKIEDF